MLNNNVSRGLVAINFTPEHILPKYFSPLSVALLCLLVYTNTVLSYNEISLTAQLVVFTALALLWFSLVGFRLRSAVFASIVLIPASLIEGVGVFMLPGMALTPNEIFSIIAILMFFARPQPLQYSRFITLLWTLFIVCLLSIVLADNPISHIGQLLRLGLSITVLTVVVASPGDVQKTPFFYAPLAWPFVVFAHLAGLEYLWRFLTFGEGRALNMAETGEVLLGSHMVVGYIFFFLPLLVYLRAPRLISFMLLSYFLILSIFSYSRSLVIGLALGLLFYILILRVAKKRSFVQMVTFTAIVGGLVFGVVTMGFFSFGTNEGLKTSSSYLRIAKIAAAYQTYLDNPMFGIGYGAAAAIDGRRQAEWIQDPDVDFLSEFIIVKASAETTPLQILAETGTVGGVVSLFILALGFQRMMQLLRMEACPLSAKLTLLALAVLFVTGFVGGNSYAAIPFFMAIPFVFSNIRWGGSYPPCLHRVKI